MWLGTSLLERFRVRYFNGLGRALTRQLSLAWHPADTAI